MATFDLDALLRNAARPRTRAELLRVGELIDCTRPASWVGFQVNAAMTKGAFEETVGAETPGMSKADKAAAGKRLHDAWRTAALACRDYQRRGVVLPSISFLLSSADGIRKVRCRLSAGVEFGRPFITMTLDGET